MLNSTNLTAIFYQTICLYVFCVLCLYILLCAMQKQDAFVSPLIDQQAKEGKDKKVVFEAKFSKANAKAKWFCRKDVRIYDFINCTFYGARIQ